MFRKASHEQLLSACGSRWRFRKAATASSSTSSRVAGGPSTRSVATAKTASPSTSWISRGGEICRMTSPSSSAMIGGPCSSSVAVTNSVKPEMSARTRTPSPTSVEVAGDLTAAVATRQRRLHLGADGHGEWASRVEAAPRRQGERARNLPGDGSFLPLVVGTGRQGGGEEGLAVRVHRTRAQRVAVRRLDDPAEIHHRDAMADVGHRREIVADEEVAHAERPLQVLQLVDDLSPDR